MMGNDFRIGDWIVRPQRDCVERGDKIVHIKPKPMAVLVHLARGAGEVVTRSDLFDSVWPGGEVTDDALTQCIVELRKAFGDSARKAKVIQTIPKVGFRLVPPVSPINSELPIITDSNVKASAPLKADTMTSASRVVLLIVSTILLAIVLFWYLTGSRHIQQNVIAERSASIAVLPFIDMSENQDQGYFADGLSEAMINRLAQLEGLQVTGRTSSFYFKGKNQELQEIAEALDVNHVLEGSVRRDEDQVRVTAQLVNVNNGFQLWAEKYDRPLSDMFAVQDEITESVATALSIKLQVGELGTTPGGTSSIEAFEEVMLARSLYLKFTSETMWQAIDHLKRATRIDPEYAYAWLALAHVYKMAPMSLGGQSSDDWLLLSRQALEQAGSLEPSLPGVLAEKMGMQINMGQWADVESTISLSKGFNFSTDTELIFVYSDFLAKTGRTGEAINLLERAHQLEPLAAGTSGQLAHMYASKGRFEEALALLESVYEHGNLRSLVSMEGVIVALSADDRDMLRIWLERADLHLEPEAKRLFETMGQLIDNRQAALNVLHDSFQQTELLDYLIAIWAAYHHDVELTLAATRRMPAPWSFWIPLMVDMRSSEGFKEIVREQGLVEYWREYTWSDYCQAVGNNDFECE